MEKFEPRLMQLISVMIAQGSYVATIPPIIEYNITVDYLINVTDDLGYSSDIVNGHFVTEPIDEEGPELKIIRPQIDRFLNQTSNTMKALVVDYGSGVKNVSLLEYYNSDNEPEYFMEDMRLVEGNKWNGLYSFTLPSANINTNYNYSVIAYDNAENGRREKTRFCNLVGILNGQKRQVLK